MWSRSVSGRAARDLCRVYRNNGFAAWRLTACLLGLTTTFLDYEAAKRLVFKTQENSAFRAGNSFISVFCSQTRFCRRGSARWRLSPLVPARFCWEGLGSGLGERQGFCVQNTKEICFRKDFTLGRRESGEEVREGG